MHETDQLDDVEKTEMSAPPRPDGYDAIKMAAAVSLLRRGDMEQDQIDPAMLAYYAWELKCQLGLAEVSISDIIQSETHLDPYQTLWQQEAAGCGFARLIMDDVGVNFAKASEKLQQMLRDDPAMFAGWTLAAPNEATARSAARNIGKQAYFFQSAGPKDDRVDALRYGLGLFNAFGRSRYTRPFGFWWERYGDWFRPFFDVQLAWDDGSGSGDRAPWHKPYLSVLLWRVLIVVGWFDADTIYPVPHNS